MTVFFQGAKGGWSETWVTAATTDLTAAEQFSRELIKKRLAMCGLGVSMVGARVARVPGTLRISRLVDFDGMGKGLQDVPASSYNQLTDPDTESADVIRTAILVRCRNTASQRQKNVWVAGIPDEVIMTNPEGPRGPAFTAWFSKYEMWRDELKLRAWGWVGREKASPAVQPVQVRGVVFRGGGIDELGVTVDPGSIAATVGSKVQLTKFLTQPRGLPTLRGIYQVSEVSTTAVAGKTTLFLLRSSGIDPTVISQMGFVQLVDFANFTADEFTIYRQTAHKRGRPFGLLRGRASTRR